MNRPELETAIADKMQTLSLDEFLMVLNFVLSLSGRLVKSNPLAFSENENQAYQPTDC
jgi:hypothetical protein